jgi:hypothetical protein
VIHPYTFQTYTSYHKILMASNERTPTSDITSIPRDPALIDGVTPLASPYDPVGRAYETIVVAFASCTLDGIVLASKLSVHHHQLVSTSSERSTHIQEA